MSNVIPFNQAPLPAYMQQYATDPNVNAAAASGTGGTSVDHISLKGGRFHIMRGGNAQTVQSFTMNVIIVHANPGMTKAFFASAYNPDAEAAPPDCASDDGIVPRADSPKVQCGTCAACPNNQFGSKINPNGSKAKLCADKKTIAVVDPGNPAGEMLRLQVPAASLSDFGALLRGLPPTVPYYAVVVEIAFDTTVDFPKIKFRPVGYVPEAAIGTVIQRHNSDEAKSIAGVAGAQPIRIPVVQQAPALAAPPAYIQQQVPVAQPPVYQQTAPVAQPQPVYQQPAAVAQPVYQQPTPVAQPVYQQPVAQPLAAAPAPADPSVAAIFGGAAQQTQPVYQQPAPVAQPQPVYQQAPAVQQPAGALLPSGREPGRPMPGKARRTKAEMAEDAAMGIGRGAGETAEDDQAAPQPAEQPQPGFGSAPAVEAPVVYAQPVGQPQVMGSDAASAFTGWDD